MFGDQGLGLNGIGLRAYLVGFPFFASGRVLSESVRIEVLVQDQAQRRQTFKVLMLFEGQRKPSFPCRNSLEAVTSAALYAIHVGLGFQIRARKICSQSAWPSIFCPVPWKV